MRTWTIYSRVAHRLESFGNNLQGIGILHNIEGGTSFQDWLSRLLLVREGVLEVAVLRWNWWWRNNTVFEVKEWQLDHFLCRVLQDVMSWRGDAASL